MPCLTYLRSTALAYVWGGSYNSVELFVEGKKEISALQRRKVSRIYAYLTLSPPPPRSLLSVRVM